MSAVLRCLRKYVVTAGLAARHYQSRRPRLANRFLHRVRSRSQILYRMYLPRTFSDRAMSTALLRRFPRLHVRQLASLGIKSEVEAGCEQRGG
ncbi:hypothetical protein K461DRAFT_274937 [Myriangium duriaei CBS 260.36]|uniref:Uncharacterized protein n=1 Tax=Myriangium duriaei CBS 260.36 TaxID=1168546 RepID=A0A9P4MQS8_9PEZI|nr:hypothetical protein K461DRAFT_274937 [Myriangium duriaei CBS 260.36]